MTSSFESGASSGSGEAVLDNVLEELANRLQAGEPVDRAAILARFPEQAESLRRLLPAMELMAQLGMSGGSVRGVGSSTIGPLDAGLGILGDFRIIREVGRGGMGVVYEAEQISLGRRVALKVLPFASALDSQQLQRFKNEAQAAASSDITRTSCRCSGSAATKGALLCDAVYRRAHAGGVDSRGAGSRGAAG